MAVLSRRYTRKIIHFTIGLLILLLSFIVDRQWLLWLIAGGTLFAFATFPYRKFSMLHKTTYNSLGTLFYPAGILTAYLLLYELPLYFFQASLMVLTLSDTAANLAGHIKQGNRWFTILGDQKSIHGIAGFIVSTLLVFFIFLPLPWLIDPYLVFLLLLISIILETVSARGSDNFSIPAGLAAFFLVTQYYTFNYPYAIMVISLVSVAAYMLYSTGILNRYTTLMAWLAGILISLLRTEWLIAVSAFFIAMIIITKIISTAHAKKE